MSIENITSFLQKFKNVLLSDVLAKEAVVQSVYDNIHVKLDTSRVEFKNNIAFITSEPAIKSQIFIKKTFILKDIERLTNKTLKDIR